MNTVKNNIIRLNAVSLNEARINAVGERHGVSVGGGGGVVIPPEEPDTPVTYVLSASVTNGVVTASVNGSAVALPYTANEGDVVVVEVTANDGYQFEAWSDGVTDNPRSITMTADVDLSAECTEVVVESKYIQFADPEVEAVLMANGVSSDGVGITMEDAAAVTSIGTWFKGNTEITSFNEFQYFTGVKNLVLNSFHGCSSLEEITFPNTLTKIDEGNSNFGAFFKCSALRKVIAEGVTYFGRRAFGDCSNLSNLDVDLSKVTVLGVQALLNCSSLIYDELNLDSCTTIGYNALAGVQIKKLRFGKVTSLPTSGQNYTNYGNKNILEVIDLPTTISSIPAYSFGEYIKLTAVICRATTPPTLANVNAFTNTNNCPIYVPDASLEAYRTATNWSTYADRIRPISEYWLENGMNETFSFAPSTTSDTSQIVNTGIKLFSDDIPTWTLRVNVSDFDFSKMPNLATALVCADETGSPYAGIHIARYTNISVIKMDINPGHANIIHTATPPTLIIRRKGNILESSTDNGLTYTTRMDDIANIITNVTGRLATIPMIVGGYYDVNGNVGRPFYGRVKVEFWKEIIDFA